MNEGHWEYANIECEKYGELNRACLKFKKEIELNF